MPPLPTMSIRSAPEHHQILRDVATALRSRPELPDVLRGVLQTQHDIRVTERDTSVLQRLDDAEGAIRRLSDRLKVLERPVAAETAELKTKRKSKPTSDIRQKVFELHDSGMIQKKIATEIGISPSYVCTILKQR
jgi:hypothetical protein